MNVKTDKWLAIMETFVNQIKSVSSTISLHAYLRRIHIIFVLNKLSKLLTFISKKSFFTFIIRDEL